MRSGWNEIDRALAAFEQLRQRMDMPAGFEDEGWPRVRLLADERAFRLEAEVPGLAEGDVDVSVHEDVVTIRGERKLTGFEGYSTHRQERKPYAFSRSFTLGTNKIDAEHVAASMKDGVLTITLPRIPEPAPRTIRVQAS
jgi:HSP20 family protein